MSDNVNNPPHYNQGEVETIDGIRAALGESFVDYCRGNVLKYVWRCGKKGDAIEDLRKAAKYLEWAIEAAESNCPEAPNSSSAEPLAIPEGWRELEPDEVPKTGDDVDIDGQWIDLLSDCNVESRYYSRRIIRKIEPANPSETPNSSTWIPKVGDKVRVVISSQYGAGICGRVNCIARSGTFTIYVVFEDNRYDAWFEPTSLELVEAAKTPDHIADANKMVNLEETPNSSTWIPRVGDKVRVVGNHPRLCGEICVVYEVYEPPLVSVASDLVSVVSDRDGDAGWLRFDQLELIEAAQ